MVYKKCPECEQWIPVACKTCPCGHSFSGRKLSASQPERKEVDEPPLEPKQRRTERTKRQRPDFFNALEFESHMRKVSRRRTESNRSEDNVESVKKSGRGRPKGSTNTKTKQTTEGDGSSNSSTPAQSVTEKDTEKEDELLYSSLPSDKIQQYSIILSEINRKFCGQNFKPV